MTRKNEAASVPETTPYCTIRMSRPASRQAEGFTLIELMLAVSIVGVLASLAVPNYMDFIDKARVARTISELHALTKDIKGFALGGGQYPDSLADIGRSTMLDPWGSPYQYWRVECGTVDDIGSLAELKLHRRTSPRTIPVIYSSSPNIERDVPLVFDSGRNQRSVRLVAAGGNGGGNGGGGNGNAGAGGGASGGAAAGGGNAGGGGNAAGGGNGNGGNGGGNGGGGGQNCGQGGARKDRHLHPISSDFDIYSMGKDKDSVKPLTAQKSHDDVIRASDGGYYGLARNF